VIAEFKEFIKRGNFIDMAVGIVMGLATLAVVTALVERLILPLIAMIVGEPNFDAIGTFGDIDPETGAAAGSVGAVITQAINFVLIAFVLFLIVKGYNRFKAKEEEEAPAADPEELTLLREIRDALRERA
jgi:large conductance mechanosensitive channel